MKKSINNSKALFCAILAVVFAIMLFCNIVTPRIGDNFHYMYSFSTGERITSIADIPASLVAHAQKMNGRLVPHALVQLLLMLPDIAFDIINSAAFVFMCVMICLIADKRPNCLLLLTTFGCTWIFMPSFGQVCLWLDGSLNYMWAYIFGLVFLLPYVRRFLGGEPLRANWQKLLFFIWAFLFGAYSENGTPAFVCAAVLLLILDGITQKKRPAADAVIGIVIACIGYVTIYLAPAQWANKSAEPTLPVIMTNIKIAVMKYRLVWELVLLFIILFVSAIIMRVDRQKLFLSAVLVVASVAGDMIMVLALYYAERSFGVSVVLLISAIAVLLPELLGGRRPAQIIAVGAAMITVVWTVYWVYIGVSDIYTISLETDANIQQIEDAYDKRGVYGEVTLKIPQPKTKYSAVNGLKYLAPKPGDWPNDKMAVYYGIKAITGEEQH